MPEAFATYDRLWAGLGTSHRLPTGMVMVSRSQTDWSGRATELDRPHRLLSPRR